VDYRRGAAADKITLSAVRISESAHRHGVTDERIGSALAVPIRMVDLGDGMVLVIVADAAAQLLEIVVAEYGGPRQRVIHAMALRAKFYRYL
jgi:hypothetical protein